MKQLKFKPAEPGVLETVLDTINKHGLDDLDISASVSGKHSTLCAFHSSLFHSSSCFHRISPMPASSPSFLRRKPCALGQRLCTPAVLVQGGSNSLFLFRLLHNPVPTLSRLAKLEPLVTSTNNDVLDANAMDPLLWAIAIAMNPVPDPASTRKIVFDDDASPEAVRVAALRKLVPGDATSPTLDAAEQLVNAYNDTNPSVKLQPFVGTPSGMVKFSHVQGGAMRIYLNFDGTTWTPFVPRALMPSSSASQLPASASQPPASASQPEQLASQPPASASQPEQPASQPTYSPEEVQRIRTDAGLLDDDPIPPVLFELYPGLENATIATFMDNEVPDFSNPEEAEDMTPMDPSQIRKANQPIPQNAKLVVLNHYKSGSVEDQQTSAWCMVDAEFTVSFDGEDGGRHGPFPDKSRVAGKFIFYVEQLGTAPTLVLEYH
jgi:hypothetical protein